MYSLIHLNFKLERFNFAFVSMFVQVIWLIIITASLVNDFLFFFKHYFCEIKYSSSVLFFISFIKLPPVVKEDKKVDGLELDQKQTQDVSREEIRL